MSQTRAMMDEDAMDGASVQDGPSVHATPAPERILTTTKHATPEDSTPSTLSDDFAQYSGSVPGDQHQQLDDAAQGTASRQRTPPSRTETLLSQVPMEVWQRIIPRLDAASALALCSINKHMVDMGDQYQVDNQPLRSTLVSALGEFGGVVVKNGDKLHQVPRLHRLATHTALFELFGENSLPERIHAEDLPSLCGRSLHALRFVLRRTELVNHSSHKLKMMVQICVPFREATYAVYREAGAPQSLLQTCRLNGSMDAIYNGDTAGFDDATGQLGDADSLGRTLADVPLSNIAAYLEHAGDAVHCTNNALTQVLVGHGVAGVEEAMAMGLSGCDGMLARVPNVLLKHEWQPLLRVCMAAKDMSLLEGLGSVLKNRSLVACVLSTVPVGTLITSTPACDFHQALVLVQGEEKAMATLRRHAHKLYLAALQVVDTGEWMLDTPQIASKLKDEGLANLYRIHRHRGAIGLLIQRNAWRTVIDIADARDLTSQLSILGMVLPEEHVVSFLLHAGAQSKTQAKHALAWVLAHQEEQLDDDAVVELYNVCHLKQALRLLVEREAWAKAIAIADPRDLVEQLKSTRKELPQEHAIRFNKLA